MPEIRNASTHTHNHRGNCFDDAWSASGDGLRAKCDDHPEFARGACSDCPDCMACFDEALSIDTAAEMDELDDFERDNWGNEENF